MKKILIYGTSLTNARKDKVENCLRENYRILTGGEQNDLISKMKDAVKVLFADVVYIAPFYHSRYRIIKMAKACKKKVVTDYYASYYDMNVLDRKIYAEEGADAKMAMNVDRIAIENSDCLIFLNKGERDYYLDVANRTDCVKKSKVIPLVIDKYPKAELKFWKNKEKIFEIVYCGTYIPLHGIEVILEAAKLLNENKVPVHFTMWGNKECVEKSKPYQIMVKQWKLDSMVSFTNDFKKEDYLRWCQKNCDCMLGVFGESRKAYTVVPNKVVDALSMEIPCITGISTGANDFFDGKTDLLTVEHNAVALATAISDLMKESQEQITKRIDKGNEIYKNFFSIENFKKSINDVFEGV
jgi:glycosyltransferase involved in cell wall biosynthesis